MKYVKFRFCSGAKNTAGLVMEYEKFCKTSVEDLSRLFPVWECMKMKKLEVSDVYETETEALNHEFFCTWNGGKDRRKFK